MDIMEAMEMLKDAGFNIDNEDSITPAETVEQEPDNFTDEEFDKVCEELGITEEDEVDKMKNDIDDYDFFSRLKKSENSNW
jgi:hypothetical protein